MCETCRLFPREPGAAGDYPLLGPALSDVYTGRVLSGDEAVDLGDMAWVRLGPAEDEPDRPRPAVRTSSPSRL